MMITSQIFPKRMPFYEGTLLAEDQPESPLTWKELQIRYGDSPAVALSLYSGDEAIDQALLIMLLPGGAAKDYHPEMTNLFGAQLANNMSEGSTVMITPPRSMKRLSKLDYLPYTTSVIQKRYVYRGPKLDEEIPFFLVPLPTVRAGNA